MAAGDSFLDTLDHTLDDWREGNFSWPENWTWGSNVDEQNKGKQTMANRNTFWDDEPTEAEINQPRVNQLLGGADNALSALRRAQGNSTDSGFGSYGNVFGNLGGLTKTNSDPYRGLRFQGFDKPMDIPNEGILPEGWDEGVDWSRFGGEDDGSPSWGSSGDDKTDWLGWSQVASGLGQAAANWKTASAMEKQIPIFQGELDFKKASFREKQDKYDTLHNNAINQQKELLKSAFFADPTRAASLRTIG